MNEVQAQAIQTLFAPHKALAAKASNGQVVIENKRGYKDRVAFKHQDPTTLLAFLWHKSKNMPLVLDESKQHKVVVSGFNSNGIAQFTMQVEVKNEKENYTSVENVLSKVNTVSRTSQATFPRPVHETMRQQWFSEVQRMLSDFNEHEFYA